jgi:hypothetical protein
VLVGLPGCRLAQVPRFQAGRPPELSEVLAQVEEVKAAAAGALAAQQGRQVLQQAQQQGHKPAWGLPQALGALALREGSEPPGPQVGAGSLAGCPHLWRQAWFACCCCRVRQPSAALAGQHRLAAVKPSMS